MSIAAISSGLANVLDISAISSDSRSDMVSNLLGSVDGLFGRQDSVSISAQALELSLQTGDTQFSVRLSSLNISLNSGLGTNSLFNFGSTSEGGNRTGLINEGGIRDLLTAAYSFADLEPPAQGTPISPLPPDVQEFWSVENTANRIADFALSNYRLRLGDAEDTPEARQEYVDYIAPAVQQGFDEAQPFLEGISSVIDQNVQEMHDLIWQRFDDFAAEGDSRTDTEVQNALSEGRRFLGIINSLPVNQSSLTPTNTSVLDLLG